MAGNQSVLQPDSIGVCTLATDALAAIREITRPVLASYCLRHGYTLYAHDQSLDPSRPPAWSKLLILGRHLPEHAWLWWTDADVFVTNHRIRLEELTAIAAGDLLITYDANGLNTGSFLLRNCDWSRDFLNRVWRIDDQVHHRWWEQWAMQRLLAVNHEDRRHVQTVPKQRLNSYPQDWSPWDFVLHVAGIADRVGRLRRARHLAEKEHAHDNV